MADPAVTTDEQAALSRLKLFVQWQTYPPLSEEELYELLGAPRYVTWAPSTPYIYGQVVCPTVRVGHLYKCVVAGTSSTVEPYWPTYTQPDSRIGLTRPHWHGFVGALPGSQVSDGNTIVWTEHGPDTLKRFDVRRAAYDGWLVKAGKAGADYDVTVDRDQYSRSQVSAFCQKQALRFLPTSIA